MQFHPLETKISKSKKKNSKNEIIAPPVAKFLPKAYRHQVTFG